MNRTVSIIVPVYNEAESLPKLYALVVENINKSISDGLISDYEMWFINDGSSDDSENVIKKI